MKVSTRYDISGDDEILRMDIRNIRDAINSAKDILEITGRTSDPTGLPTTTGTVYLWFRTDTNALKAYVNGSVKSVTLS